MDDDRWQLVEQVQPRITEHAAVHQRANRWATCARWVLGLALVPLGVNVGQWVHALEAGLPLPGLFSVGALTVALGTGAVVCATVAQRLLDHHVCFEAEVVLDGWARRHAGA